jgi:hypothetical protein
MVVATAGANLAGFILLVVEVELGLLAERDQVLVVVLAEQD